MERLALLFNAPHRIKAQAGTLIRVEQGRVWLTLTDLAEDIVLQAGQVFRVPHAGRVVVEAWDGLRNPASIVVIRRNSEDSAADRSDFAANTMH